MIRTLRRYVAEVNGTEKEYVELSCDSGDDKPSVTGLINGSMLTETDTGKVYMVDEDAGDWVEQFSLQDLGGGGSGLPSVTSDDNGDVLTVVEGAWAKADAPSEFFTVTVSDSGFGTITADKTYSEINAAFLTGKPILMVYKSTMMLTISAVSLMDKTSWVENYVSVTAFVGNISDTQCVAITSTGITLRNRSALPAVSASDNGKTLQVVNGAWAASSGAAEKLTVYKSGSWGVSGEPSSGFVGNIGVVVQIQSGYQIMNQAVILGSGYASYTAIDAIALYVDALDSNKVKWLLIHIDKNDAAQNTFTETDYAT